jgi:hypothetical protein
MLTTRSHRLEAIGPVCSCTQCQRAHEKVNTIFSNVESSLPDGTPTQSFDREPWRRRTTRRRQPVL